MTWQPISTAPEGVVILTKIDDVNGPRNQTKLKKSGRLWFVPDGSMYVYYTPTHWWSFDGEPLPPPPEQGQ